MKITKPSAIVGVELPCPICGGECATPGGSFMFTLTDTQALCHACQVAHTIDLDVFLTKDERLEEIAAIVKIALLQLPTKSLTRNTEQAYRLGISAAEQAFHLILALCKQGETND